ncbi:hypothetical protein [Yoonia sp.]|uniref:hypothetical protein n=1 Tax=Yoonia sp. TaxID=2212373 RepID=UPI0039748679
MRNILLSASVLLFGLSNLASGQENRLLSLELVSAEIDDNSRSLTASLLRRMQLESGLTVTVLARNNSDGAIIDINLWESACGILEEGNSVEPVCGKLHQIILHDGNGNDLRGGATKQSLTLYPSEQSIITIHGRRPASTDGSFTLIIDGVSLTGSANQ